jgi:hypothetical protein
MVEPRRQLAPNEDLQDFVLATTSAPLVIGATGGSGTRVVARLARHAGYDLGRHLNQADDALSFRPFHDQWINRFIAAQNRQVSLSQKETERMTADFRHAVEQHLSPSTVEKETRWGWKAPRSIYLLSFFHAQFPALKFIHVLRDGRDMAFSKNQNQLRKHACVVLSWRERWFDSEPVRSVLLWARVNLRAAEYGEMQLGKNYLAVRFEDLCQQPVEATARIMRFLEVNLDAESVARAEISPPLSLGRWRKYPAPLVATLLDVGSVALEKFGYLK